MYEEKTIANYSKRLSKHHRIPNSLVFKILKVGFINMLSMMKKKEDIRVGHFFRFVTNKLETQEIILAKRKQLKTRRAKWQSQLASEAKADPEKQPH